MVKSTEIIDKIQQALTPNDWKIVKGRIIDLDLTYGRKGRKTILSDINDILVDTALKTNKTSFLYGIYEIPSTEIEDLFSEILTQFIKTNDDSWLKSLIFLSDILGKKSYQSRVFALMARDLIKAGVSLSQRSHIEQGMMMLDRISFRKYRSDIMIDIIPLLTVWSINTCDEKCLRTSLCLIEDISDVSKRAVLHSEIAQAIALIAILERNRPLYIESIKIATDIPQKNRRQQSIKIIIEKGFRSSFPKDIFDIAEFIKIFTDGNPDKQLEILSAQIDQILEHEKDKTQIAKVIQSLCQSQAFMTETIIINLLKKAEKSGDIWYFEYALKHQHFNPDPDNYPIREIIKAGISVSRYSNEMSVLSDIIPIIEKNCNPDYLSRVYLQFSQIMLASDNFEYTLHIFGKVDHESENIISYTDCLTNLLINGLKKNSIIKISNSILQKLPADISHNAISRAIICFSRDAPFDDIIYHIPSLKDLIKLHPQNDSLFHNCITLLADRGFLESHEPDILIKLANTINDVTIRERAVSNIIIKIAQMGVVANNRDFLQRAVGLTCQIEGQDTRSVTLSRIIDEATMLAAQQGDLDLLLRMKEWSSSLLEKDLAVFANVNIIKSVLKYAINQQSIEALEKAYLIAQEIDDPAIKNKLIENIVECFIKIGCIQFKEQTILPNTHDISPTLFPFCRALEIIKNNKRSAEVSLKIAGLIDIIITFSKKSDNPDFVIPLAIYSVEIDNALEREAMLSRIISNINEKIHLPSSTDPNEIMAYLLLKSERTQSNPLILHLISRILHLVQDPYRQLMGLTDLADAVLKSGDTKQCSDILTEIYDLVKNLSIQYQKAMILADLTTLFCQIDPIIAKKCLAEGIQILDTENSSNSENARRHILFAIVKMNAITPDKSLINVAFNIVSKIKDPVDYINSLITLSHMVHNDTDYCSSLLQLIEERIEKIPSAYERASILLDLIPIAVQCNKDDAFMPLLKKAENLTRSINIQYIADRIRDNIVQMALMLHRSRNDTKYLHFALEITGSIDDDGLRLRRFRQMGKPDTNNIPPLYQKIRVMTKKLLENGAHPSQIVSLEHMIRSVADRGKESLFFCNISIIFKEEGNEKLSKRMMQSAINEARIIRPLSRRAYVMCDLALKSHVAGCENTAQEVLDHAIDAATNIRQSGLRDEVFDELGLAIKLMQVI